MVNNQKSDYNWHFSAFIKMYSLYYIGELIEMDKFHAVSIESDSVLWNSKCPGIVFFCETDVYF